jgi:hypothetical protein
MTTQGRRHAPPGLRQRFAHDRGLSGESSPLLQTQREGQGCALKEIRQGVDLEKNCSNYSDEPTPMRDVDNTWEYTRKRFLHGDSGCPDAAHTGLEHGRGMVVVVVHEVLADEVVQQGGVRRGRWHLMRLRHKAGNDRHEGAVAVTRATAAVWQWTCEVQPRAVRQRVAGVTRVCAS